MQRLAIIYNSMSKKQTTSSAGKTGIAKWKFLLVGILFLAALFLGGSLGSEALVGIGLVGLVATVAIGAFYYGSF